MAFGGRRSCFTFSTLTIKLWKSNRSASKVKQSSTHLLIRNKSVQDGLSTFLKQVGSLFRLILIAKCFHLCFVRFNIKKPITVDFLLYVSNALPISPT